MGCAASGQAKANVDSAPTADGAAAATAGEASVASADFDALLAGDPTELDLSKETLQAKNLMSCWGNPPSTLWSCLSIVDLNLCDSDLTIVDGVEKLVNLTVLNISENALTSLPDAIGNLVLLEEFVAYKNKLRVLPASFTDLISLKEVNFYNNVLEELPRDLTKLKNLESLNFANNPLLELPALEGLTKLTSIKCHMCNIEVIEGSWETLESLEELMFNSNAITDIPKMPAGVQELDFVRCKLTRVDPSRLELCTALKEFKANTCQLTEFPAGALVESMESFGISGNPDVTDLPAKIGICVNMLTFVINGTGITKLPKEMMQLTKLTRLNIQNCPLDLTDEDTKAVLEQLKEQCSGRDENGKAKGYFKA